MDWLIWFAEIIRPKFFDGITLIAFLGAAKFLVEYIQDNRRKRLELDIKLREEFRTNENFSDIFEALEAYDIADESVKAAESAKLTTIRLDKRLEFAAFLEDIALIMKSGALKARVINYMFGYYAIACWEAEPFWADLRVSKDDPYWSLLKNFVWWMKFHRRILSAAPWIVTFSLRI